MSRSKHVTLNDLKGLTKSQLEEMMSKPNSLLQQWTDKNIIKKEVKKTRRKQKQINQNKF